MTDLTVNVINGFRTIFSLVKSINEKAIDNAVKTQTSELLTCLLSLQIDQLAINHRNSELEKKVADMNAWNSEADRYELKDVGNGCLAYVIKPEAQAGEPVHWLCANCFSKNKKSILQTTYEGVGPLSTCHDCKLFINVIRAHTHPPLYSLK